jgi:hypothetical protein
MKNILTKIFAYMKAYSGVILATIGILTVVGVVLHSAYVTSIPLFIFLCGLILFLVGVVIIAVQSHEYI